MANNGMLETKQLEVFEMQNGTFSLLDFLLLSMLLYTLFCSRNIQESIMKFPNLDNVTQSGESE